MRKFLVTIIPIITLILFVLIMISGNILKKPLGKDDDIPQSINDMIEAVNNESWKEADNNLKSLKKAWDKVVIRLQFGAERDEINYMSTSIARLQGAIQAEEKSDALMELYEAYDHWNELGN